MRKRVPVASVDILSNGRPGCVSRLAFTLKRHLEGASLRIAQDKLAQGLGYRHLTEMVHEGKGDSAAFPPMGAITLRDIEQTFAWGLHRKCNMGYLAALRIAEKLDLSQLKVYQFTKDALLSQSEDLRSAFLKQEAISQAELQASPVAAELVTAGAPSFSYAVNFDGELRLFQMNTLVESTQSLLPQLSELLADEEDLEGRTPEVRRLNYLRDELIASHWCPLREAVRSGFTPEGVSIAILTNKSGDFRGRCVYFEGIGGLVPRIHQDDGVYEDIVMILADRAAYGDVESLSEEGAHSGTVVFKAGEDGKGMTIFSHISDERISLDGKVKAVYDGDEAMYRLDPRALEVSTNLHQLIDNGHADKVKVDTSLLIQLNQVTYRDSRFMVDMRISLSGENHTGFDSNGKLVAKSVHNQKFCGESMHVGEQILVRDQPWLREEDVPAFIIPPAAFPSYKKDFRDPTKTTFQRSIFDKSVPQWVTTVHHAFDDAWNRASRAPYHHASDFQKALYSPDKGLAELLPQAIRFFLQFRDHEAALTTTLDLAHKVERLALVAHGIDDASTRATLDSLHASAVTQLKTAAAQILPPEANFLTALVRHGIDSVLIHGWLVLAVAGIPLRELLRAVPSEATLTAKLAKVSVKSVYSRVISALVLGPAFNLGGKTLDAPETVSDEVLLTVANGILEKKVLAEEAYRVTTQLQSALDKNSMTLTWIGAVGGAEKVLFERRKDAHDSGYLSVGNRLVFPNDR